MAKYRIVKDDDYFRVQIGKPKYWLGVVLTAELTWESPRWGRYLFDTLEDAKNNIKERNEQDKTRERWKKENGEVVFETD